MRGKIIAHSSKKKKDSKKLVLGLESQLKDAEKELGDDHTEDCLRRVCKLKFQLNELYSRKVEYAMFRMRSTFYESGEKARRCN